MWSRLPIRAYALAYVFAISRTLAFQPDPAALRKLFEDALARRQQTYGETDTRTAQAARDLGLFLCRSGDGPSARRAMANAVHLDEKALGSNAPQTLEDIATLASVSPRPEAEPLLRRAAESPDPTVAGPALTSLAAIRKAAGDSTSAAALLRRAVEKAETADGKDSITVALVLNVLAQVVPAKEALLLLQRALAIEERQLEPQNPQTLQDARKLANLLRATGQPDEAAKLERQFKISPSH
jgi:tetratricopeptide (TPR) repeat protein